MGNQVDNKFTWVIKNFSSLPSEPIYSDQFIIGGCKWRLLAYPKGYNKPDYFSLFLQVSDYQSLPLGWRRQARYLLTVVNTQSFEKSSKGKGSKQWFDKKVYGWGAMSMFALNELNGKDGGFLVNDEVKIVAEVEVLEVIGTLDVTEESEGSTQPLKRIKLECGAESKDLDDTMDVINGFQILPSQVEFVNRVFQKHPDIALVFQSKKQYPRTSCMFALLGLIETLCKSVEELSNDDLVEADNSLTYLKHSGFKVDWLEEKLEEVKGKKKVEQIGETRVQELEKELNDFKQRCSDIEEELKDLKQKCLDTEELLVEEKAKVLTVRASPLTLDDIV